MRHTQAAVGTGEQPFDALSGLRTPRRIAVVGPGAMGILFAVRLSQSGDTVYLVDHRPERASRLNVRLRDFDGEMPFAGTILATPEQMSEIPPVDSLLFCVKAYSTRAAGEWTKPLAGRNTAVVTLQNGLGNAEILMEIFGSENVLVGTTSDGATLLEEGIAFHAGHGFTRIGAVDPSRQTDAERLCDLLREAGFRTDTVADWKVAVWTKAIINAAINPLTALLGVPNGMLAELPDAREILVRLAREGADIARRAGIPVSDHLPEEAVEVCRMTAQNRSSMLQDMERGRRTELEFINGALLWEAKRWAMETPTLETVTRLAAARENASRRSVS